METKPQVDREPTESPQSASATSRRLAIGVMVLAAVIAIGGLAIQQLRSRGTDVVGALSIADFGATVEADDRPASGFEMRALEGNDPVRLSDYPGKIVVLNFWASWCGPCRVEARDLQAIWEKYRERNVQFIGVDYQDDLYAGRGFVDEFEITYPSVFDPAGRLVFDYGLVGLPSTFVISPDRRIAYRFVGIVDREALDKAVRELLATTSG